MIFPSTLDYVCSLNIAVELAPFTQGGIQNEGTV